MSLAERKFREELSSLLQKTVTVHTTFGKNYVGTLTGIDVNTMSICLSDVKNEKGMSVHKLFINGQAILQIYSVEKPFNLNSLAERLERVFPKMVKVIEEAGVIVVMNKIRVTEKGIIEGSGPAAERVQKVYEEFIKEHAKGA
jgi:small nuclear ribonucleoprotein (snRNP)-like protein